MSKKLTNMTISNVNKKLKDRWKGNLEGSGYNMSSFFQRVLPYLVKYKTGDQLLDVIKVGVEKDGK